MNKPMTENPTCPYCNVLAVLVGGEFIYSYRPDLYHLKFWLCRSCKAYTGTHINSKDHKPKGRLANAELRAAKVRAHAAFDPLWKGGKMTRKEAYRWLQEQMKAKKQPHIGWMGVEQCNQVVSICQQHKSQALAS